MNLDHVPDHVKPALMAANANRPLAQLESPQPILDRLEKGETAIQIAESLGISKVALYKYLLRQCPEEWTAMSAAMQLAKVDDAQAILDDPIQASDNVTVARVRESAKLATWQLERVARKMYGQKDESANGVNIQVVIAPMDGETGVTIEHDSNV